MGTHKNTFEYPKQMIKLMGKKKSTILPIKFACLDVCIGEENLSKSTDAIRERFQLYFHKTL